MRFLDENGLLPGPLSLLQPGRRRAVSTQKAEALGAALRQRFAQEAKLADEARAADDRVSAPSTREGNTRRMRHLVPRSPTAGELATSITSIGRGWSDVVSAHADGSEKIFLVRLDDSDATGIARSLVDERRSLQALIDESAAASAPSPFQPTSSAQQRLTR